MNFNYLYHKRRVLRIFILFEGIRWRSNVYKARKNRLECQRRFYFRIDNDSI
jgi:hypothetical protein